MNILIVDDYPSNLKLLRAQLEAEGHTVFESRDGLEALELLRQQPVDAVISDILMPRMDGYRLCHEIRQSERLRDLPIIIYTSTYTSPSDQKLAEELGADRYLKKPASLEIIIAALKEITSPPRSLQRSKPLKEVEVLKEYSERLVAKLESKNIELSAAHERLRLQATAMETAANAIIITDPGGKMLWVNEAFTRMTGYAFEEALGKTPRLLQSGKHDAAFYRDFWKTISSGQTWRGEFINRRKDGALYYDEHTVTPIRDAQGEITHYIGILHDVTARKQAEEEVRATHEKLRQLLAHSPAVIYTLKLEGTNVVPTVVSDNIERLLGVTAAESTNYEWWRESLHPDDRDRVLAETQSAFARGGFSIEYRVRHKNGTYLWIEDNNRVIRDEAGQSKGAVGVWTDITEHKRAEERLQESEERYRKLAELSPDGIVIHCQSKVIYANQVMARLLGLASGEELIGRDVFDFLHPSYQETARARLRQVLEEKKTVPPLAEKLIRPDGTYFDAELTCGPFLHEGKPAALSVIRDITERKMLEEKSLRNQRLESLGTLAGGIAHDLNNVLAPILMSLEILRLKFADESSQKILSTISGSAQRGAELVKQILAFSRGMQGERVAVQLRHVVREMQGIIRHTFPQTIALDVQVASDLWTVKGDATQLHQVLMNLCVNARDAMPQGGKLTISGENFVLDAAFAQMNPEAKPGPHVVLSVTDTGTGMSADVRRRVFEPFFTTKAPGQGTGLGLSTALGIAKSHGGFVSVYSELGRGTKFKVYLPAEQSPETERTLTERAPLPIGQGELILVADDEIAIQQIARETLQMHAYRVLTANNGAEAVALCAQHDQDLKLVITDMMMPIMDGPATVRAIRVLAPAVKIIAASGLGAEAKEADPQKLGVDAFLKKPFTAETLLRTVGGTLHG